LTISPAETPIPLSSAHDPWKLPRLVDVFADDLRAFGSWLRTIRDDRAAEVARRSYWHFNGFAKLVLQAGKDYKVRLHVWPAGEHRLGENNPHGHRWNFASTVLCGDGLHDTHYVEADSGVTYERYQYTGGNVAGALTHVGTVQLATSGVRTIRAGDRYDLDTSVIHTVRPLGTALVATLVCQGAACVASTPVYGIPGVDVDEPGRAISADEVRGLICDVLAALDSQGN
jgi:hypothetical protein